MKYLRWAAAIATLVAVVAACDPEPAPPPPPPRVVAVYGDSLTVQAEDYLAWFYGERDMVPEFHAIGGIAPCDVLQGMRDAPAPAVAVVSFVGNMLTACTQDRGTPQDVYAADFEAVASIFESRNIPLVWMSPPMRVGVSESDNWIATLMQRVATKHGQRYADAADALADSTHVYVRALPCEQADVDAGWCTAGTALVRADDDGHLRPSGARRWAARIVDAS